MGSRGNAIILLLLAMGVFGWVAQQTYAKLRQGGDGALKVKTQTIAEALRTHISGVIHCGLTNAANAGCAADQPLSLYADNNTKFIDTPFSKVGRFDVRASCGATAQHYRVEFRNPGLSDWTQLFGGEGTSCAP